jgi:hypothetical protein
MFFGPLEKICLVLGIILVTGTLVQAYANGEGLTNSTVIKPITEPNDIEPVNESQTETTTTLETTVQTSLIIDTYPEGATVTINGDMIGITPITVECGAGEYALGLHLDNYKDISKTVTAEEGKETQLEYTLSEETVTEETTTEETTEEETTTVDENTDEPIPEVTDTPVITLTPENTTKDCITLKLTKMVCRVLGTTECLKFGPGTKMYDVTWNGKNYYLIEKK